MALVAIAACRMVMDIGDPQLIEIGAPCSGDLTCSAEAPICIPTGFGSAQYCSTSCGNGAAGSGSNAPDPPVGGDAICRSRVSTGTPACLLYGVAQNGVVPWWCAILCGTLGSDNLGDCPSGLVCISNSCQ